MRLLHGTTRAQPKCICSSGDRVVAGAGHSAAYIMRSNVRARQTCPGEQDETHTMHCAAPCLYFGCLRRCPLVAIRKRADGPCPQAWSTPPRAPHMRGSTQTGRVGFCRRPADGRRASPSMRRLGHARCGRFPSQPRPGPEGGCARMAMQLRWAGVSGASARVGGHRRVKPRLSGTQTRNH